MKTAGRHHDELAPAAESGELSRWVITSCPAMNFRMSKWYLDCITDSGDASIAYTGRAAWGPVHLYYSSLLQSRGQTITTRHSLRSHREPYSDNGSICWNSNPLGVAAEWTRDSIELSRTIFTCETGSVEWHCVMPRARARISGTKKFN